MGAKETTKSVRVLQMASLKLASAVENADPFPGLTLGSDVLAP